MQADMPVAIVENGTAINQRVSTAQLTQLANWHSRWPARR
jgi:siroheme synthase